MSYLGYGNVPADVLHSLKTGGRALGGAVAPVVVNQGAAGPNHAGGLAASGQQPQQRTHEQIPLRASIKVGLGKIPPFVSLNPSNHFQVKSRSSQYDDCHKTLWCPLQGGWH
jgi:hypothetical protein